MEARFPWERASILARPGLTPMTVPSFRTSGNKRVRAPEGELGRRDEIAPLVESRGEERLLLAGSERHCFGGDLDF